MKTKRSIRSIIAINITAICLLFLTGCETNYTQTTSGKDYLSKYPTAVGGSENGGDQSSDFEQQLYNAANAEPLLRFPARIGLAKIYNGSIVNLTSEEAAAWTDAQQKLGSQFGSFIPVSQLIAESAYQHPNNHAAARSASEVMKKVRLGAARQHLDAVLVYEVFSETKSTTLASSVAAWTIIGGYFVPSEKIETVGYANALLIDVRNGYPYGTASASVSKKEFGTMANVWDKKRNVEEKNQIAATIKLIPETEEMMLKLMGELR